MQADELINQYATTFVTNLIAAIGETNQANAQGQLQQLKDVMKPNLPPSDEV